MQYKRFLQVLFISLLSTSMFAQKGVIRGNIFDKGTGDPIMFGNVILSGTDFGTTTDLDGFFALPDIPVGNYQLIASFIGYVSDTIPVEVQANAILYKRIVLSESAVNLGVVNISATKEKARSDVQISQLRISAKELKSLPSTGGEPDIAQYLSVLPGIISTGDQGGQLYIRGGSPIQNKIMLDGMTIYNPFHSIGFFSVFETEIIKNVDVLTGGFNAEHGGRISAIVNIHTKEGNKKRFSGIVSGSPFLAKAMIEGPIVPLNEKTGSSASFLLTAKQSLIEKTSPILYSYASSDSSKTLPYNFQDIYGKLSFVGGKGSKLNLFGFNFTDGVNYSDITKLNWNSAGGGAQFYVIPPSTNLTMNGNISFSKYNIVLDEGDGKPRESGIDGFSAGITFNNYHKNSEFKYGFELNGYKTQFKFTNFLNNTIEQIDNTTEISAFVKYKQKWGNVILEPGLRAIYYASLSQGVLEPRLGIKYNISDRFRFKAAGGFYSQNIISTVNENDIVNLFVGFLSGPEEVIFVKNTKEKTTDKLQKAIHGVAGLEIDVTNRTTLNIEPYYKRFTQIIGLNRNKRDPSDANYMTETGDAYGIDLSVKHTTKNWYLWATYSHGYVNRDDGFQVYPTLFDRRNNVNLLATYSFGSAQTWEASFRWNYGSGFPFTLTQAFYEHLDFKDGLDTDYTTPNGNLGTIFSDKRNSGRLPDYHRLDLSLKKIFTFSRNAKLEVTASLTNSYNRKNIFYFDRVSYKRVDQLPILPSLGAKFGF